MISYALKLLKYHLSLPVILLSLGTGFLCLLICRRKARQGGITRARGTALSLLCAYLMLALSILLLSRRIKGDASYIRPLFWSYRQIAAGRVNYTYQVVLNVLLFLPFGFLWPFVDGRPSFWRTVGLGVCFSLAMESMQALSGRGIFELDDLLHNCVGTAIGAGVWMLVSRHVRRRREAAPAEECGSEREAGTAGENGMEAQNEKLLLSLIRAGIAGEEPELASVQERWDEISPEALADLARRHDVTLTVYAALGRTEEPVLQQLKTLLKKSYASGLARAVNQDGEGTALLDALEREGIDCIPLKGWILRRFYADPLSRSMTDLDILVRQYRYDQILGALEPLGYRGRGHSSWKHDTFTKDPYMTVEMHSRLTDDSGTLREWERGVWERAVPEEGCSHRFRMSPEDFYIFHLVHMHKDFVNGALGFRRLADLWILKEKSGFQSREELRRTLESLGLALFAERMERLADVCFAGAKADEDSELLLRFASEGAIYTDELRHKLGRMASGSGASVHMAKLRSLLGMVFPPRARMKALYPQLERYPALLPWFWGKRIFHFIGHPKGRLKSLDFGDLTDEQFARMRSVFRAGGILPEEKERN